MSIANILKLLKLDRDKVLKILKREEEIRFSDKYIQQCNAVANIPNAWLDVTSEMQKKVAEEFGYIDPIINTLAVYIIRKAKDIYPDEEIKNSVVHFRENFAHQGKFKEGDKIINPILYNSINGNNCRLYDILDNEKKNIILAGSHT